MRVARRLFRFTDRVIARRSFAVAVGAALIVGCLGDIPALASAGISGTTDEAGNAPTIHYLEAMAHASDPAAFTPGDAVSIPYAPRPGDRTVIDGAFPVALPAGSATGYAMADSPQGSVWATGEVPPTGGSDRQIVSRPLHAAPAAVTNVLRREVYGFLPYWNLGRPINYDVISTIAYFGVDLYTDGNLHKQYSTGGATKEWAGWTSSTMTNVINTAHANHDRVVLTIESFAWDSGGAAAQAELLSSPAHRQTAVQQIVGAVRDRGADGVNLDFEPIASGQSANFVAFVREMRAAFDTIHAGYELTFCATGHIANYDAAKLLAPGAADNVFIMGYDFRDGGSSYAASHDPLTSPRVFDLTDSVNQYKALAPASKIILGLPYYGLAFSTVDTSVYSKNQSGATYGAAVWAPYYTAANLAKTNLVQYDTIEESAWVSYYGSFGGQPTWRELYYNDARALAARCDRVNYWGLDGVGIWALGYDDGFPELNQVLADKFLTDLNPPKVGVSNIAPTQVSESFTVSWTGRDDWNGIKSYDLQVSTDGGAWTSWITGTTETSSSFSGENGHEYAFRVRATDGVNNVGAWNLTAAYTASPTFEVGGFATVVAGSVVERALPSTSAAVDFTVTTGTVFQIIGGPVSADGFTWYQVTGPITELNPVTPPFPGCWVAVGDGTNVYVVPSTPPNTTAVSAGIGALSIGTPGQPPSLTGLDAGRTFSPDGDDIRDTISLSWTNTFDYIDETLSIFRPDGSLVGTIDLGALAAGSHSYTWDGTSDGTTKVADGQYMLQITGTTSTATYYAPCTGPFDGAAWARFGVIVDTAPGGTFFSIVPVRVLDTRSGLGLKGAFGAGVSRSFAVAGQGGIPADAIAVTGNVTITGATKGGFLRLGSTTAGTSSTINFPAGDTRANGVTLGLADDGSLSALFVNSAGAGSVQVILDVTGYFLRGGSGATFVPIAPKRIVDTRAGTGLKKPLTANAIATFTVAGQAGIPSDAIAVVGNATIVGQNGNGYITVAPSIDPGEPKVSTINFPKGDIRANNLVVALNAGKLAVEYRSGTGTRVDFIFDVTGYFVPGLSGAMFVPLAPGRVVDSRVAQGLGGAIKATGPHAFAVWGHASVTQAAIAVVGNLTVTDHRAGGWLAVTPTPTASTSALNFPPGDVRANGFTCPLGPGGELTVTYGGTVSTSTTHVVVDILGYYR